MNLRPYDSLTFPLLLENGKVMRVDSLSVNNYNDKFLKTAARSDDYVTYQAHMRMHVNVIHIITTRRR